MTNPTPPDDDLDQLKRAFSALKKARARISALEQARSEPVAIVGIGCRLPGDCNTPQSFWEFLRDGRSAMRNPPADRWDAETYLATYPDEPGKMQSALSGFLEQVDQFDPHFFGISPREAHAMDPQQRLALESAWEALEDAGIIPADLAGTNTGVFIGIGLNDYGRLQIPAQAADPTQMDNYFIQGNALCITANRISYALDLRGPSMAIDTACSSSLTALHTACQSLRNGDSTLALVGGSNVILSPDNSIALGKFLAPDGLCKTFDSRANGYTRGEGVVVFVLKRLSAAEAAGDRIYAVIRGSALNQDGFSSGLTVPNGAAQEAMLRAALHNAGLQPADIDYIEAHGTGTALGDPIEANAIGAVFAAGRIPGDELWIGSVKTNIGHLEAGAGIAGVLKVALALYHDEIPPSLNYLAPNPMIDFPALQLRVVTQPTPWPKRDRPNRAGISSFGFGGANAHIFLEAAPMHEAASTPEDRPVQLFTLSAKTPQVLTDYARHFADFLSQNSQLPLSAVCDTLNRRRTQFAQRLAAAASSPQELIETLQAFSEGQPAANLISGHAERTQPRVAFLFTGQGSQYTGMGQELYKSEPVFREVLDRCETIFRQETGESLLQILFSDQSQPPRVDQTAITQPALFAIEYALAELWRAKGFVPAAVMGHSIGEYVAACVAGVFSLEDAMKLVIARGRLMGALPAGGMMATVFAPVEQVQAAIAGLEQVSIAAVNAPDSTVISGATAEIERLLAQFQSGEVQFRRLVVSHAFHSPLMEPILDAFEEIATQCSFSAPKIPLISNISGQPFAPGQLPDAAYWRAHLRTPVQFAAGFQSLHAQGFELFLECGPNPVLINLGKRCLPEGVGIWVNSLRQGQPERLQIAKGVGAFYAHGLHVQWDLVNGPHVFPHLSLPTYPFQHERYWFKTPVLRQPREQGLQPLLGRRLRSPGLQGAIFETQIHPDTLGYLWDHRAYGAAIFPATGYIEMMLSAAANFQPGIVWALEELTIQDTLLLPSEAGVTVQVVLNPQPNTEIEAKIYSSSIDQNDRDEWHLHAFARLAPATSPAAPTLETARDACSQAETAPAFYAELQQMGMDYGPAFQNIRELWRGEGQALARIELGEILSSNGYSAHPALLDACLQVVAATFPPSEETYLPIGFDQVQLSSGLDRELWSSIRVLPGQTPQALRADIDLYAGDGRLVGTLRGMRIQRASHTTVQRLIHRAAGHSPFADWLYRMEWPEKALPEAAHATTLPGNWLIFADDARGAALADLRPASVLATAGETTAQVSPTRWTLRAENPQDFHQLLQAVQPEGVICLSSAAQSALHLLQAACALPALPQVWFATAGAQPVLSTGGADDVAVQAAALWGLARSARLEYPDLWLHSVDLDPAALPENNARALWNEIEAQAGEEEVAYRNDLRFAAQLARMPVTEKSKQPVRLEITSRGELDHLALKPLQRQTLHSGEVEIAVRATGLNFRDVLNTLDMYPGDAGGLGHECSGVVSAVAQDVTHVQPGDTVLALASDCFATVAVTRQEFVARKPVEMSFEQAATIPIAFLTADYALNSLGEMRPGERVLIHAAAGGVGLAAVQLAQLAGAEIFATAGSPEKRAMLHNLGVQHVMDSRSLDFAAEILRLTDGEGVHLALNSLADAFIPASLSVMAQGGRFLEIGKRGIWTHAQVDALGKNLAYHIIYLGEVCDQNPGLIGGLLRDLMGKFDSGALHPLPWHAFPIEQATEAFRFMAKARHTGKIVLTQASLPVAQPTPRKDASYLITGGLGGIGISIARQLAEAGAGQIILAGLNAPTPANIETITSLEASTGAQITAIIADVSRRDEVERLLETIQRKHLPLAGIVHTAGVLDDGILAQQTWERFSRVMAPKGDAAWNLHHCSARLPLDFFVIFSAGAGWLGSPGQTGYAAANTVLDSLAYYRRARGLPAVTIAWGPWSRVGMASRLSATDQERMARQGLGTIAPEEGRQAFESLLGANGAVAVLPVNWARYAAQGRLPARFSALASQAQPSATAERASAPTVDARQQLNAAPHSKRRPLLQAHLREHAVRVLGLSTNFSLDTRQPLRELGMDSLMAVELRNAISASLQQKLPSTLLFDFPTIEALTDLLSAALWPEAKAEPAEQPQKAAAVSTAAVENLSDEEAEALLLAELEKPKKK